MIWNREAETMPRARLRELQLERLRWSVQWAYDRVPFQRHGPVLYAELCAEHRGDDA